ncbi:hypothetical protein I552_9022 [Mycobacterium xenopi 3993]|nr:hypothetical protein I552_9022 [Mycobacterium xenopi 3993]
MCQRRLRSQCRVQLQSLSPPGDTRLPSRLERSTAKRSPGTRFVASAPVTTVGTDRRSSLPGCPKHIGVQPFTTAVSRRPASGWRR